MIANSMKRWICAIAAVLCAGTVGPAAHAQDFFSALFGGFVRQRAAPLRVPFANEGGPYAPPVEFQRPRYSSYGGGRAYCVRTCDGRYFPLATSGNQSQAAACNSFCPASETRVVYGSNIDEAETDSGKAYSELPNAFRYRDEIVAGCTCDGKDPVGLAQVKIEDDPTLRKGDIVAGKDGLVVAQSSAGRHGGSAMNFSPAPERIRAKYRRAPVVARR